jgi:carbonic anhydrase
MNQQIKFILNYLLIPLLFSCNTAKEQKVHHQSESAEAGAEYLMPGLDHGLLQSPINILSNEVVANRHQVTLNFNGQIEDVQNLGHTVQLDFEPGNTITIDDKTYEFKQIHFHTPSEHLIDGITYPMEMHVVNTRSVDKSRDSTEYLVLAFLLKMGNENKLINQFLSKVPEEDNTSVPLDLNLVKQTDFFKSDTLAAGGDHCYHYQGSLTTPPYTESVSWFIMKKIFEASPDQIRAINEIEGDNARHIQSRNQREITN